MMRFAVSNTANGVLIYLSKEARSKMGSHLDINVKDHSLIIRPGGGVNINDGKHNSTDIPCQGMVQTTPLTTTLPRFGKTEFGFTEHTDRTVVINLARPVDSYRAPRKYKNSRVEDSIVDAVADELAIQEAVSLINSLPDEYHLSIDTQNNSLVIRKEQVFK